MYEYYITYIANTHWKTAHIGSVLRLPYSLNTCEEIKKITEYLKESENDYDNITITFIRELEKDDVQNIIEQAIHGLDVFAKNWCVDRKETIIQGEVIYKCNKCEFLKGKCKCLVKTFVAEHSCEEQLKNLGATTEL